MHLPVHTVRLCAVTSPPRQTPSTPFREVISKNNIAREKVPECFLSRKTGSASLQARITSTLCSFSDRATNKHPTAKCFHESGICMPRCSDVIDCCRAEKENFLKGDGTDHICTGFFFFLMMLSCPVVLLVVWAVVVSTSHGPVFFFFLVWGKETCKMVLVADVGSHVIPH